VIQAIALVLDFAPPHWSPSTRMVAVALADYANTDNGHAWPSVANLADAQDVDQAGAALPAPDRARRLDRTPTRYPQAGYNPVDMAQTHRRRGDTHVTPPVTPVSPPRLIEG
jgi:hypothetical protein